MNAEEKRVYKKVVCILDGIDNPSEEILECIKLMDRFIGIPAVISEIEEKKICDRSYEDISNFVSDSKMYKVESKYEHSSEYSRKRISSKKLYKKYQNYCYMNDIIPTTQSRFKRKMIELGFCYKKSLKINNIVTSGYEFYERNSQTTNN